MDGEGLRQLGHRAVDLASDHLEGRPGHRSVPSAVRRLPRDSPPPEAGRPVADSLDRVATQVLPYPVGNASPPLLRRLHHAELPPAVAPHSPPAAVGVLGDPLAAASNPSCTFGVRADVGCITQACRQPWLWERCAVRWLSELGRLRRRQHGGRGS